MLDCGILSWDQKSNQYADPLFPIKGTRTWEDAILIQLRINPIYPSPGWLGERMTCWIGKWKLQNNQQPECLRCCLKQISLTCSDFLPRKRIRCVLLLKAPHLFLSLYIPSASRMSAGTLETYALSLAMFSGMNSSAIIWKGSSHMDSWCWFSVYDVWLYLEITHINSLIASPLLSLLAKTVCTLISFTPHSNTMRNVIMISLYKQAHQNFN